MKIRVVYRDYTIRDWDLIDGEAARAFGRLSSNTATIYVDRSSEPEKVVNTTLHELLHAVWHEMCISDEDDEERTVTALANGLTQVMRDNPAFIIGLVNQIEGQ